MHIVIARLLFKFLHFGIIWPHAVKGFSWPAKSASAIRRRGMVIVVEGARPTLSAYII